MKIIRRKIEEISYSLVNVMRKKIRHNLHISAVPRTSIPGCLSASVHETKEPSKAQVSFLIWRRFITSCLSSLPRTHRPLKIINIIKGFGRHYASAARQLGHSRRSRSTSSSSLITAIKDLRLEITPELPSRPPTTPACTKDPAVPCQVLSCRGIQGAEEGEGRGGV